MLNNYTQNHKCIRVLFIVLLVNLDIELYSRKIILHRINMDMIIMFLIWLVIV